MKGRLENGALLPAEFNACDAVFENATPIAGISQAVSIDEAHLYNKMMIERRAFRGVADSEEYLELLAR